MESQNIRSYLSVVCFYILPIAIFTTIVGGNFLLDQAILKKISVGFGITGFTILVFIMFVKPLSRFFQNITLFFTIVSLRRQLGVATCYLILGHVGGLFLTTKLLAHIDKWIINVKGNLFMGAVSLILIVILALTSNNFSVQKLKRNWKRLHYIAYPALFAAIMHKFGMGGSEIYVPLSIIGIFILLKILESSGVVIRKRK